jgi:hypothetical protein
MTMTMMTTVAMTMRRMDRRRDSPEARRGAVK